MGHDRVIVIGSGVAGLACARELQTRGYQVLVVEARTRVGGRLKGEPLELATPSADEDPQTGTNSTATSQSIDLGGALIHGIEGNPAHAITTQMGVPLHEISDYCLLLDENGWPFDPKEDEKLSVLYNECLDITFQRVEEDKESTRTFGDLFDEVCREKGVSPDNPLLKWHQANLELPTGADFHELGYTWNDDEPYGFAGTHAAVEPSWKFVMERLADGLDIVYNSPVTQVQVVLPSGVTPKDLTLSLHKVEKPTPAVKEEETEPPVRIVRRTEWKNSEKAPSASSATRFSRRIRGEDVNLRRSARSNKGVIHNLQIGMKAAISYDDPTKQHTRRKRPRSENGESSGDQPAASRVQVTLQNGNVLEASAVVCTLPLGVLKVPPNKPGHVSFVPPLPPPKQQAIDQLGCGLLNKCAMSFPSVFWQDSEFLGLAGSTHSYLVLNAMKYTGKPILVFMYGGSFARELESWTDTQIVDDCLAVLKKICGKEVPTPVDYCVTRWGQELYSRMAFTYIPPGVDGHSQLAAAGEAIQDPVLPGKPLIMFAGEHTTPYHPSTMHGAFLSGIREAYRYDLFVEPALNDNMEFDTDHKIYEYTFQNRRVFKDSDSSTKPKKESPPAPVSSSEIRTRRRRFAGMALRKQPKQVVHENATPTPPPAKKPQAPTSDTTGSRRSQRSLSTRKVADVTDSPNVKSEGEIEQEQKALVDSLEDRTLLRSLESYGRDCTLLRSKIIPVFGSSRKRNADQIRTRWQHLATRRRSPQVLKQWEAETVAVVPSSDNGLHGKSEDQANPSAENGNLRRSSREVKPRVLPDV